MEATGTVILAVQRGGKPVLLDWGDDLNTYVIELGIDETGYIAYGVPINPGIYRCDALFILDGYRAEIHVSRCSIVYEYGRNGGV
jgi:hypothetical protein